MEKNDFNWYPRGSYCEVATRHTVLGGQSQEEVEKLAKLYSSSPKKNYKKIRMESGNGFYYVGKEKEYEKNIDLGGETYILGKKMG